MSNSDLINLNKIFNDLIDFHINLIKEHTEEIIKLQNVRLVKIKALFSSFDSNIVGNETKSQLETVTLKSNHGGNQPFDNQPFDNQLFNELHNNELHNNEPNTTPELNTRMVGDLQSNLDEQDLIWDRIRKSQLGEDTIHQNIKNELNNNTQEITNTSAIQTTGKENNLLISNLNVFNSNIEPNETSSQLAADLKSYELYQKPTPPKINALFKVNPTQRQTIIKNIFKQATKNITKLSLVDDKYKNAFDTEVQNEADRLLEVYLQTH